MRAKSCFERDTIARIRSHRAPGPGISLDYHYEPPQTLPPYQVARFLCHWVLSKLHPRTAPRKKTPLAPRRTTQAPPAAYPPTLAPPPAPRVEHAPWASPMPLGGAVRPSYRALYGQLRAVRGASEGVLSDNFVAPAPTCSDTRGHFRPRCRGFTPRSTRSREGHGRRRPHRRDRYAANQGSGGGDGGGWR